MTLLRQTQLRQGVRSLQIAPFYKAGIFVVGQNGIYLSKDKSIRK